MTLEQLPIRETRNIRLASRSWAAADVEHLFRRHFIVRPNQGMSRINYLDDLSKLEAVSQKPHISKDLILIEFASSDMPMPHFLLFLLDQKQAMTRGQWSRTISGIDIPSQGACERSILEKIFQYLPRLDQIFVRSLVRPTRYADYNLPTLGGWVDDYNRSRRQLVNLPFCCERRRCGAILLTANKLQLPLYSLHVEYFPIGCFWSSEAPSSSNTAPGRKLPYDSLPGDDTTRKTMSKVRYLSLGLAFNRNFSTNSFTYDLMFLSHELGRWLACFEGLRSLELGLSIQETCWHNQFMTQFSEALSRIIFPHLVKLNFKRLLLIPQDIQPFILNHSSTIRYLGIDGGYFVPGGGGGNDTRECLTTICDKMKKLERFSFIPDHDGRLLIYHNWNWDRLPEDNTKPIKVTHLIEYFVLRKCPWPMIPEGQDCLWRPKFLGTHEQFLAMSLEEQEDYFEKRWEWVVGADGIDPDGDLEIGSDEEEEVDVDMERDSDLASFHQLI